MTPWKLREAVRQLAMGGIVAYPTEAVYGLGCNPFHADAVMRLLALKGRPAAKGLILVAAEPEQLDPLLLPVPASMKRRALAAWPGPVTWLWPARPEVPGWLRGEHDTLAVRVSAHPLVRALCLAWGGPLVSTSANRAGQTPARTALDVRYRLDDDVDLVLHGATGGRAAPTAIRDLESGRTVRQ